MQLFFFLSEFFFKKGMVVHTFNPNTQEVETGKLLS